MFDRKPKSLLILTDLLLFAFSLGFLFWLRMGWFGPEVFTGLGVWLVLWTNLVCMYVFGAYDLSGILGPLRLGFRIFLAVVFSLLIIVVANYLAGTERAGIFGRGILLGSEISFFGLAYLLRLSIVRFLGTVSDRAEWLIITTKEMLEGIRSDLNRAHFPGRPIFQVNLDLVVGDLRNRWAGVVVAMDRRGLRDNKVLAKILMDARFSGQPIYDICSFYERVWKKVPIQFLDFEWFISSEGFRLFSNPIGLKLKRLGDLVLAGLLIFVSWPVLVLAMLVIRMESTGAALYSQVRTGKDGKEFTIFKLRTMHTDAEQNGPQWAAAKDSRVTRVGNFLRKTRIDELPQLFNIFKGEMSFIGPRPERPEFNQILEAQIPFYGLRHLVPPGLTGWAQILYPYGGSVEDAVQKLQYELFYIKNQSLVMDLKIVLRTIQVVLFGRGR